MTAIVFLLVGLMIGAATGYLYFQLRQNRSQYVPMEQYQQVVEQSMQWQIENGRLAERVQYLTEEQNQILRQLEEERQQKAQLSAELARSQTTLEYLKQKLNEEKKEIEALQDKFKSEFKNIANELLEDKSKRFTEQNQQKLNEILNPLSESIKKFEKKVEEAYEKELRDKISLREEVKKLFELNQKISQEANNLTKALKGDIKKQGNWGELILEKVLERSGLTKDIEYKIQYSTTNEDGQRIQPDVVVLLPDKKHIIIDAKVSLVAYHNMINTDNEESRQKYLQEHVQSVRNHIKNLHEKNYTTAVDLYSPDFILLFMPIESSFSIAVQADHELFHYAWDRKIVIVSPSTLLATLRTIASIWKQERQTRNAMEIARQSGALYDKFKGFIDDMTTIGKKIDEAKSTYENAMSKLYKGSGNIIRRIEEIKKLGARTEKNLPQSLIDRATE